jgi:hypothetical protein
MVCKCAAQSAGRKQKWGPALLPAPTAPSEGSAGLQVWIPKDLFSKSELTSSGVASYQTTPSEEETDRLPDCATRRFACLPTIGAWQSQSRPIFHGPSWVDRSFVPLCSSVRRLPSRVALEEDQLFRRLFPTGPELLRRVSHCRSAEIGPSVTLRFLLSLAGLPVEAGTSVPITLEQCTSPPSRGSEIYVLKPVDNGDIGNNSGNLAESPQSVPVTPPDSARTQESRRCASPSRFAPPPGLACRAG